MKGAGRGKRNLCHKWTKGLNTDLVEKKIKKILKMRWFMLLEGKFVLKVISFNKNLISRSNLKVFSSVFLANFPIFSVEKNYAIKRAVLLCIGCSFLVAPPFEEPKWRYPLKRMPKCLVKSFLNSEHWSQRVQNLMIFVERMGFVK